METPGAGVVLLVAHGFVAVAADQLLTKDILLVSRCSFVRISNASSYT